MSIKIAPDFCLWCHEVRIVNGKCKKCLTKYDGRMDTYRKKTRWHVNGRGNVSGIRIGGTNQIRATKMWGW